MWSLLVKHHWLPKPLQVRDFFGAVNYALKAIIDAMVATPDWLIHIRLNPGEVG